MQSSLGATLKLSVERIVASALGASLGAIVSTYFGQNLVLLGLAIFLLGLVASGFRVEKTGYRYASITFAIIVLIPRAETPWIVAMYRFLEVAIGILVALAVVALWPERDGASE
jgi:uncharacterized membrane protein YgaE (UPF0421/DUF939 family)